jgi:hypothetical protein
MNGRRNFVKGFGLLSAALAGGVAAGAQGRDASMGSPVVSNPNITPAIPPIDPSILAQLEEESTNLCLNRSYGEIAPPEPQPSGHYFFSGSSGEEVMRLSSDGGLMIGGSRKKFVPGTENQVSVKMAPGPDGELYLNIKGKWKRVLTT